MSHRRDPFARRAFLSEGRARAGLPCSKGPHVDARQTWCFSRTRESSLAPPLEAVSLRIVRALDTSKISLGFGLDAASVHVWVPASRTTEHQRAVCPVPARSRASLTTNVGSRFSHFHIKTPPPRNAANPSRRLRRCLKRSVEGELRSMMSPLSLFRPTPRRANSRGQDAPHRWARKQLQSTTAYHEGRSANGGHPLAA